MKLEKYLYLLSKGYKDIFYWTSPIALLMIFAAKRYSNRWQDIRQQTDSYQEINICVQSQCISVFPPVPEA